MKRMVEEKAISYELGITEDVILENDEDYAFETDSADFGKKLAILNIFIRTKELELIRKNLNELEAISRTDLLVDRKKRELTKLYDNFDKNYSLLIGINLNEEEIAELKTNFENFDKDFKPNCFNDGSYTLNLKSKDFIKFYEILGYKKYKDFINFIDKEILGSDPGEGLSPLYEEE